MGCDKCCHNCKHFINIEYFEAQGLYDNTEEWLEINCSHNPDRQFYDLSEAESFAECFHCENYQPIAEEDLETEIEDKLLFFSENYDDETLERVSEIVDLEDIEDCDELEDIIADLDDFENNELNNEGLPRWRPILISSCLPKSKNYATEEFLEFEQTHELTAVDYCYEVELAEQDMRVWFEKLPENISNLFTDCVIPDFTDELSEKTMVQSIEGISERLKKLYSGDKIPEFKEIRDVFLAYTSFLLLYENEFEEKEEDITKSVTDFIDILGKLKYEDFLVDLDWNPIGILLECGYQHLIPKYLYYKPWLAMSLNSKLNHYSVALYNRGYALSCFFNINKELFDLEVNVEKGTLTYTEFFKEVKVTSVYHTKWDFDDNSVLFLTNLAETVYKSRSKEITIPLSVAADLSYENNCYIRYFYTFPDELRKSARVPEKIDQSLVLSLNGITLEELFRKEFGKHYYSKHILSSMFPTFERFERFFNFNGFKTNLFDAKSFDDKLKLTPYDGPFRHYEKQKDNAAGACIYYEKCKVCEVTFNQEEKTRYNYLCSDDSIKIGDRVLVPIGSDNVITVATVVSFPVKLRFPEDKMKFIFSKDEESR